MWNRSYHWQQRVRIASGVVVLFASAGLLLALAETSPARRARAGARELWDEVRADSDELIDVVVDRSLGARPRTLVYLDREDGVAQVVGRVMEVEPVDDAHVRLGIRLALTGGADAPVSGVLKGAAASLDLREAVQLLLSPGTPNEEAAIARDTIWPSVRAHILPAMTDGLIRGIAERFSALDAEDQALFQRSYEQLRAELKPLENQLVDRFARRSWEVVGVKGLAAGILRSTTDSMQSRGTAISDFWWRILGTSTSKPSPERPFFSEETVDALRKALESEAVEFWKQHRGEIVEIVMRVVGEHRGDFEQAFADRWAVPLYEQAVVPAWQQGQEQVLAAVQAYANDFAARRLLTREGGPRMLFAYALRSALKISDAPLLVFAPGESAGGQRIRYESILQ